MLDRAGLDSVRRSTAYLLCQLQGAASRSSKRMVTPPSWKVSRIYEQRKGSNCNYASGSRLFIPNLAEFRMDELRRHEIGCKPKAEHIRVSLLQRTPVKLSERIIALNHLT